jgi:hypothetical protein
VGDLEAPMMEAPMPDAQTPDTPVGARTPSDGTTEQGAPSARGADPTPPGGALSSRRSRRRLRGGTWVALVLGVIAVGLAARDRAASQRASAPIMSSETGQRRVFPNLGDYAASAATIELQRVGGPTVRIVPDAEGHLVTADGVVLGPADPSAVDGVWSSLRMATTLRAAEDESSLGDGGHVRVSLPDIAWTLSLGAASPDGVGVYGRLDGVEGGAWIVERELAWLIEQDPFTWVSKRLLDVEPAAVTSIAWGDALALARGDDGFWRANLGGGRELLNTATVERRLARIFSTRLEPFVARGTADSGEFRPWLVIGFPDGRTRTLVHGGPCPGAPELVLVDRGPGELGCVPSSLVDPWPVANPDAALVETRLVPWAYGRIVAIDLEEGPAQTAPTRGLARRGGGWIMQEEGRDRDAAEAEVYRWVSAIGELEIALEEPPFTELPVEYTVVFASDSGSKLRVQCGRVDGALWCARDGAPPRRILGERGELLRFSAEQFQDRAMLVFSSDDVRAVELLPGDHGPVTEPPDTWTGVRQAARLDLGVWRLDAPDHPDGDAALDDVRAAALVATLASLRSETWVEGSIDPRVIRTIHVDLAAGARVGGSATSEGETPRERGGAAALDVVLHPGCVVSIEGLRAATIDAATCEDLSSDLLFVDPIAGALRTARSVRLDLGTDRERVVRREGAEWRGEDGVTDVAATSRLAELEALRSRGIVQRRGSTGERGAAIDPMFGVDSTRFEVRREEGDVTFVVGPDAAAPSLVQIVGRPWLYRVAGSGDQREPARRAPELGEPKLEAPGGGE